MGFSRCIALAIKIQLENNIAHENDYPQMFATSLFSMTRDLFAEALLGESLAATETGLPSSFRVKQNGGYYHSLRNYFEEHAGL